MPHFLRRKVKWRMSEPREPWPRSTFTVASDERLTFLIETARERLIVVAPALTKPVAEALSYRLRDEGRINITVVLDADPEVYRLGYGDLEALALLQQAADENLIGLSRQEGVRIGMIAADDQMIIYSPVPKLIEAGSTSVQKPNAIQLGGAAVKAVATAAGATNDNAAAQHEIGHAPLTPAEVREMEAELEREPPQQFDIARAGRVFSSKLQYVEFKVQNSRFNSRRVPLPPELMNVADQRLKDRITSGVKPPADALGPFTINIVDEDGKARKQKVGEKWLTQERERIEQAYTFEVPGFGRVILRSEIARFEAEVDRFKTNLNAYREAVNASLHKVKSSFAKAMAAEFLPRWRQRPPEYITRFNPKPSVAELREELEHLCLHAVEQAFTFEEPDVRIVPKDIAAESAQQERFLERLRTAMEKKRIPRARINKMFEMWDAAEGSRDRRTW